jgi:predicted DNA-binding transcriptional regulator YafY
VHPWGVVSWRGRWYLVGHDLDRADTRVFRLSRIIGQPKPTGKPGSVTVPEGTDVRSIVLRNVEEPERISAKLLVREGAGLGLRRRATSVRPHGDGWDVVEFAVSQVYRLVDEVLGFGADVLVLEPPEARDAVVTRLRALAGKRTARL